MTPPLPTSDVVPVQAVHTNHPTKRESKVPVQISATKKNTNAGLRFPNPHRHQQSDDRSPVKAVQTSIFTQRTVLIPTFKRREETQVLGLRGGTNHPQKLRPKVYLLSTPTKNTFFFGFHASEKSNFQQRRERRCQYARFFFFFRIC